MVMDIEGTEIEILLSNNTNFKNCKFLFIELHNSKYEGVIYNVDDMISILINKYHFSLLIEMIMFVFLIKYNFYDSRN